MKLFHCSTPSFRRLTDNFVASLPRCFEPVHFAPPAELDGAEWGQEKFLKMMLWSQGEIVRIIRENQGDVIAFGGGDTMFFGDPMPLIESMMKSHDVLFAPNSPAANKCCPEFMVIRCNAETLAYQETVLKHCGPRLRNDSLMTQLAPLAKVAILPHSKFWNLGRDEGEFSWTPEQSLPALPQDMIWFHANWTTGIENKLALIERVKALKNLNAPLRLNIGAANTNLDGFVAIDRKFGTEAFPLKYETGTVDQIRASHILEHFNYADAKKALKEWTRVLKVGGLLEISVPDFDKIAEIRKTSHSWRFLLSGGQVDENDQHLSVWAKDELTGFMEEQGLEVSPWGGDARDTSCHVCSLNLQGVKRALITCGMPPSFAAELPAQPPAGKRAAKICAIVSLPRVGFNDFWGEAVAALFQLGIPARRYQGAFWEQGVQNLFEDLIKEGFDLVVCMDYDSVFTQDQLDRLIKHLAANDDIDALAALQNKRCSQYPLLTAFGKKQHEISGEPFQVSTAHFGLTVIRLDAVKEMKKPWFHGQPDKTGGWRGDDRLDADIWFWHQWRLQGRKVFVDPSVRIGHLEIMVSQFNDNFKVEHVSINDWREAQKLKGKVE